MSLGLGSKPPSKKGMPKLSYLEESPFRPHSCRSLLRHVPLRDPLRKLGLWDDRASMGNEWSWDQPTMGGGKPRRGCTHTGARHGGQHNGNPRKRTARSRTIASIPPNLLSLMSRTVGMWMFCLILLRAVKIGKRDIFAISSARATGTQDNSYIVFFNHSTTSNKLAS